MDLTPVFIMGFLSFFTYKIIVVLSQRKERILFVEKLSEINDTNVDINKVLNQETNKFSPLRWSLLLLGVGLGLLVGLVINQVFFGYVQTYSELTYISRISVSTVYGACTMIFGGAGLLISYLIENKHKK